MRSNNVAELIKLTDNFIRLSEAGAINDSAKLKEAIEDHLATLTPTEDYRYRLGVIGLLTHSTADTVDRELTLEHGGRFDIKHNVLIEEFNAFGRMMDLPQATVVGAQSPTPPRLH